jgi:hypothetical protein
VGLQEGNLWCESEKILGPWMTMTTIAFPGNCDSSTTESLPPQHLWKRARDLSFDDLALTLTILIDTITAIDSYIMHLNPIIKESALRQRSLSLSEQKTPFGPG